MLATQSGVELKLDEQLEQLLTDGWPEHLMLYEYAKLTSQSLIEKAHDEFKEMDLDVHKNVSDELMNLVELVV